MSLVTSAATRNGWDHFAGTGQKTVFPRHVMDRSVFRKSLVCNGFRSERCHSHDRCLAVRSDMSTLETTELECVRVKTENVIHMPAGLLGFEDIKRFVLLTDPEEAPFSWFQVLDDASLAFLVLPPFDAIPSYQPEISDDDVSYLGLKTTFDALI